MKKIIWLCNAPFNRKGQKVSGTWLQPLAEAIHKSERYELVNVSLRNGVKRVLEEDIDGIKQYVLPGHGRLKLGLLRKPWENARFKELKNIVEAEKPDLVHIWGVEELWATAYRKGYVDAPRVLLGIQGLRYAYVPYFYGGLSLLETFKCLGPVEMLYPPMSVWGLKLGFYISGKEEKRCIKEFKYVTGTTEWVRDQIKTVNPDAKYFFIKRMMRQEFYDMKEPWQPHDFGDAPKLFATSKGSVPYKGFHILVRALYEIKKEYPNVHLNIACNFIRLKGYSRYVIRLIKSLGLQDNITFLGHIDAAEIVRQLKMADVCVIPSFIETYCNAFAESLYVGTPTVGSFNGAMSELAVKDEEALYYNSVDYVACASNVLRLLKDKELAVKLSINGRSRRLKESAYDKILNDQFAVYEEILRQE